MQKFQFITDIWHCPNAFELVDVSYYKEVWLSLTKILSVANVLENSWLNWYHFFKKGERRQPNITRPASYTLVIRWPRVLKRKIQQRVKAVIQISSVKRVLQNFTNRKIPALEWLSNKAAGVWPAIVSKKRLWCRCSPVSFPKYFDTFFQYSSNDCFWKGTGLH